MQIAATYDELVAAAREREARAAAEHPIPRTINVPAVLALGQPRTLDLGGVGLRAPPPSFAAGARIHVLAHALRELRQTDTLNLATVRLAATIALQHVTPARRRWPGWRARFRRALQQDPATLEHLLWWLIAVRDEAPQVVTRRSSAPLDLMDQLAGFVRDMPGWTGPDGFPLSWAHYIHGTRHLQRAKAREDLRQALAVRVGGADQKSYGKFQAEWQEAAGWAGHG